MGKLGDTGQGADLGGPPAEEGLGKGRVRSEGPGVDGPQRQQAGEAMTAAKIRFPMFMVASDNGLQY